MAGSSSDRTMRAAMATVAVVAWFAVLLQLLLTISGSSGGDLLRSIVNYFSFFTILTNLLVAAGLSLPIVASESAGGRFFLRPSV